MAHRREPGFLFNVLKGFPFPEYGDVGVYHKDNVLEEQFFVEGVVVVIDENNLPVLPEVGAVINTNGRVVVKDGKLATSTLRYADNWRFETDQFADGIMGTVKVGDKVKVERVANDAKTQEPRFQYAVTTELAEDAIGVVTEKRPNSVVISCPAK